MIAYIDTSVVAAYYCPEPLSAPATARLQRLDRRIISPLVEVEFISAVAIKTRMRQISLLDARTILGQFRSQLSQGLFEMVEIGANEYAVAAEWLAAFTTPLRAPDALHLAATMNHQLTLVTSDRALANSASLVRVKCELIT